MLIVFIKTPEAPMWKGFFISFFMFSTAFTQNLLHQHLWYIASQAALGMRAALIAAVYRKALRISSRATQRTTVGEMVNLMAVDIARIQEYNYHSWIEGVARSMSLSRSRSCSARSGPQCSSDSRS